MEHSTDNETTLQRELAKAKAEIAELRSQLDAQRNAFDFNRALERIKAKEADNAAYQAEMEKRLNNTSISTTGDYI